MTIQRAGIGYTFVYVDTMVTKVKNDKKSYSPATMPFLSDFPKSVGCHKKVDYAGS